MSFDTAIQFVLAHEGGYVNDPNDAGGETNFGISKRSYPQLNIRHITREGATIIYRRDYWDPLNLDAFPAKLAMAVFDTAVNAGISRAVKLLQQTLNVSWQPKLEEDGVMGEKTRLALDGLVAGVSAHDLVNEYLLLRLQFYRRIIASNHSQQRFMSGWVNRVLDLYEEVSK